MPYLYNPTCGNKYLSIEKCCGKSWFGEVELKIITGFIVLKLIVIVHESQWWSQLLQELNLETIEWFHPGQFALGIACLDVTVQGVIVNKANPLWFSLKIRWRG